MQLSDIFMTYEYIGSYKSYNSLFLLAESYPLSENNHNLFAELSFSSFALLSA